jgi:hypothetical protein
MYTESKNGTTIQGATERTHVFFSLHNKLTRNFQKSFCDTCTFYGNIRTEFVTCEVGILFKEQFQKESFESYCAQLYFPFMKASV